MTVNDIVKRARRALGDSDNTGWLDATLIDYVDQAQKDLCKTAGVYRRTLYLGILNDTELYPLPEDCFQVNRVEYMGTALDVLSREDQDIRHSPKGLHIIKSDLNMKSIELSHYINTDNYASFWEVPNSPDPAEFTTPIPVLGVTSSVGSSKSEVVLDQPVGVVTGLELLFDEDSVFMPYGDVSGYKAAGISSNPNGYDLGVMVQFALLEDDKSSFGFLSNVNTNTVKGVYGICTDVLALDTYVKVYYSAQSSTVNSLYDALILDDIWAKALVHYVVGTARQDDNDEGNYSIGSRELDYYDDEIKKAKKMQARSYTSNVSEIKQTTYRRI